MAAALPVKARVGEGEAHHVGALPARLRVLRAFEVSTEAGPVAVPLSSQRVMAFLALHGQPVQRAFVAGTLWPASDDRRAAASLRTALWRLGVPGLDVVDANGTMLGLARSVSVDIDGMVDIAHRLEDGQPVPGSQALTGVAGSFDDDLLVDWYDDWLVVWRERWRQLRLRALERLAASLAAEGAYGWAVEAGLAAVRAEPLRESAHRAVVAVHLAEGNFSEALRQYTAYRTLLADELGLDPSPVMERLVAPLLRSRGCALR